MWRQLLAVEQPEVTTYFPILAHRIGHARPCIHTGKRRPNKRKKYGEGLAQHKDSAFARSQQRIADYHHHVADRSR